MVKLVMMTSNFVNQWCELADGEFAVGRDPQNNLVIRDPSVSAVHCKLLIYGSEVIVRDCGSRNGTFVNGTRVPAQSGVKHGQIIRMGRIEVRVEIDFTEPGDGLTPVSAIYEYRDLNRYDPEAAIARLPVTFTPVEPQTSR
jgi:pSer/pThr/pTyr-binding forkhead associated (FHA) protein